jgi:hypothetical protein
VNIIELAGQCGDGNTAQRLEELPSGCRVAHLVIFRGRVRQVIRNDGNLTPPYLPLRIGLGVQGNQNPACVEFLVDPSYDGLGDQRRAGLSQLEM